MNKVLKKVAVVLLTVILLVVMIPSQPVKAEEDTYTVYVQVPDGWGSVYLWAWGDAGVGNMSKTWPGEKMLDNGNGFYSYTLKDKYVNLVFSDNGSSQSEDIRVNGSDVEIVVNSDGTYVANYLENFQTEWEDGINVTVTVPEDWKNPYIWAWDDTIGDVYDKWPGAPMTSVDDGYTVELPGWVTGVIINANNAGVQTVDISVEAGKNIKLQVNSTDDIVVEYVSGNSGNAGDGNAEDTTTVAGDDGNTSNNESTATPEGEQNNKGNDKPNNNNVIYIVVPVAVFVIIILIVTFTGNGRNKKHSQHKYYDDTNVGDIKIDDDDLDIDVDDIDV